MPNHAPLMILVAGPYRSGTGDDPDKLAANVRAMEDYALPILRAGHIPIVGEWLALPLVALAGSQRVGDAVFDEMGGPSQGADLMVKTAKDRGLNVYHSLNEIPGCETSEVAAR